MRALTFVAALWATFALGQSIPMIPGFPTNSGGAAGSNLCIEGTTLTSVFINSVLAQQTYSLEPMAAVPTGVKFNIDAVRFTINSVATTDGGAAPMVFSATDGTNICACRVACPVDAGVTGALGLYVGCDGGCAFDPKSPMTYAWSDLGACGDTPPTVLGNLTVEGHCLDGGIDAGVPDAGPPLGALAFAPESGAGMGGADCPASFVPTTADGGQNLAFFRGSAATCTSGVDGTRTTGIVEGDVTYVTGNQVRVMRDADGVRGMLVEQESTNYALYSGDFSQPNWIAYCTSGPCTVTPAATLAPDNTLTAARFQFSSCGFSLASSLITNADGVDARYNTGSFYIKGNGTSGTLTVAAFVPTSGFTNYGEGTVCNYNSTTWTRCTATRDNGTAPGFTNNRSIAFGCLNITNMNGGSDTGGGDVFVAMAQSETLDHMTSYVPTSAATATRALETSNIVMPGALKPGSTYSLSAYISSAKSSTDSWVAVQLSNIGSVPPSVFADQNWSFSNQINCTSDDGATSISASGAVSSAFATKKMVCYNDGTAETGFFGAAPLGPIAGTRSGAGTVVAQLGSNAFGNQLDGIISRVCADSSSTVCQ